MSKYHLSGVDAKQVNQRWCYQNITKKKKKMFSKKNFGSYLSYVLFKLIIIVIGQSFILKSKTLLQISVTLCDQTFDFC